MFCLFISSLNKKRYIQLVETKKTCVIYWYFTILYNYIQLHWLSSHGLFPLSEVPGSVCGGGGSRRTLWTLAEPWMLRAAGTGSDGAIMPYQIIWGFPWFPLHLGPKINYFDGIFHETMKHHLFWGTTILRKPLYKWDTQTLWTIWLRKGSIFSVDGHQRMGKLWSSNVFRGTLFADKAIQKWTKKHNMIYMNNYVSRDI